MNETEVLSRAVKALLKFKSWTTEKLATEAGIHRGTVSAILNCRPTSGANHATLVKIAECGGLSLADFLRLGAEED